MHARPGFGLFAVLALLVAPLIAGQETRYGAGVTVQEADAAPFARVQGQPSSLEGQTIRVDGKITSVGTKTTCWMGMAGAGGSDYGIPVFVRADPCTIMFPKSAVGHRVSVQGVLMPIRLDPDPVVKEAALEYGQEETGGTPPLWEFKATGVVVSKD